MMNEKSMEEELLGCDDAGVKVSMFNHSVENHFKAVDTISKLCGETQKCSAEECEIQRLTSSVTFLREWRYYNYNPRIIRFGSESQASSVCLPQLSSATVPKHEEGPHEKTKYSKSSKDFVLYVGGPVWGLDWCPRVHERPDCPVKNEFIAVSAHPPDSTYHKIGAPLIGRGMIQIWCILNISGSEEAKEDDPIDAKKPRGRPGKKPVNEDGKNQLTQPKKPRGRPRKYPRDESVDIIDCNNQLIEALAVHYPEGTSEFLAIEGASGNTPVHSVRESKGRPRERARKYPRDKLVDNINCDNQLIEALAVQYPESPSEFLAIEGASGNTKEHSVRKNNGKRQKGSTLTMSACDSTPKKSMQKRRLKRKARSSNNVGDPSQPLLTENECKVSSVANYHIDDTSGKDIVDSNSGSNHTFMDIGSGACSIPDDVALPRVVLCLAHDGKVAWDVKWRPFKESDFRCMHRMGYLAALLGNGSLQVWDVPLPHAIKSIYSSCCEEGEERTDPRFLKLEPIFRCSMVKSGGIQSIPLTVEWSTSPHKDFLLAGCHDGTVALWKFSADGSSVDTKPLLCFSADTFPIRAVAWAPVGSDPESASVILTAGHGGMKFWDIRDPFRPLWDIHPAPRFIYSMDWLPDPRCVIFSLDDGTMRLLNLVKSAYDIPVHGKLTIGPKQLGLHTFNCSSFAIWNVQVSRLTGMVAYCSADGTVVRFQLTRKAAENDFARNRAPHFLCGSLCVDEYVLVVSSPLLDTALTLKKPMNDSVDTPRSMRDFLSPPNHLKRSNDEKAKGPMPDKHTLALCYGDDPGTESGPDETLAFLKSKARPKSRSSKKNAKDGAMLSRDEGSSKKKTQDDLGFLCEDEEPDMHGKENGNEGKSNQTENFPSKTVAMHRVRWNMNKGSERWLCYGGAAGIVRCQEIMTSNAAWK